MSPRRRAPVPALRAVRVPGKGRGLVAGRRFESGEIVDTAPVLVIPARQWATVEATILGDYCFAWDDRTGSVALALGRVSLLNHSYSPNVVASKSLPSRLISFTALRDIDEGEELTLNYNGDPECRDPLGFEVRD